jgi:WD40 repeat protein
MAVGADLLCAGTASGSIHTWTTTSIPSHEEHALSDKGITGLAIAVVAGQAYFIAGLKSGELSVIDAVSSQVLWKVAAGKRISAVKTILLGGRPTVLAAVDMSEDRYRLNVCRLWDLSSGDEIDTFDPVREQKRSFGYAGGGWRLATQGYMRDKSITAIATWQAPDGPMAAACCSAAPISVWLLEEQRQVTELSVDITGAQDLDFGSGHLVAGAGDKLHIWNPPRQWSGFQVPAYHAITSIACGTWGGKPCIASGGYDGSLRMWRFDGSQLATIDIDERITALAYVPDGRFAVGTSRGLVVIETD